MKQKGFTLIELLTVISVIGLLSSIVLVSINSARRKARNTAKIETLLTLINAFNLGLDNSGSLPVPSLPNFFGACINSDCPQSLMDPTVDAFLAPYMKKPFISTGGGASAMFYYVTVVPFNGVPGAYIMYWLEPPASCGPGTFNYLAPNWLQCQIKID